VFFSNFTRNAQAHPRRSEARKGQLDFHPARCDVQQSGECPPPPVPRSGIASARRCFLSLSCPTCLTFSGLSCAFLLSPICFCFWLSTCSAPAPDRSRPLPTARSCRAAMRPCSRTSTGMWRRATRWGGERRRAEQRQDGGDGGALRQRELAK
jgi:hypothetical protein